MLIILEICLEIHVLLGETISMLSAMYNNLKYKNSPFYKGVELWNLLPLDIATSDSLFQFKHSMKKKYKTFCDTTA